MVVIQCPHCENDIELEDDASGLFDCPHCDEEFSWGSDLDDEGEFYESGVMQWWSDSSVLTKFGIILNVIGTVTFGFWAVAIESMDYIWHAVFLAIPFWIIGSLLLIIAFLIRIFEGMLFR